MEEMAAGAFGRARNYGCVGPFKVFLSLCLWTIDRMCHLSVNLVLDFILKAAELVSNDVQSTFLLICIQKDIKEAYR